MIILETNKVRNIYNVYSTAFEIDKKDKVIA